MNEQWLQPESCWSFWWICHSYHCSKDVNCLGGFLLLLWAHLTCRGGLSCGLCIFWKSAAWFGSPSILQQFSSYLPSHSPVGVEWNPRFFAGNQLVFLILEVHRYFRQYHSSVNFCGGILCYDSLDGCSCARLEIVELMWRETTVHVSGSQDSCLLSVHNCAQRDAI